jgi:outer membrane lipoprotein-sorting protein
MKRFLCLVLAAVFCFVAPVWAEQTADEILKSVDDQATQFKDLKTKLKIIVRGADGVEKTANGLTLQKGPKRLYRFFDTGMAFMSLDPDTSYVYLPEDQKVRRIAAHTHNQSFMGTDYNADDMAITRYDDVYAPKLLETTPKEFALELTPKAGKASSYSKIVIHVDREINAIVRLEYYNPKGEKEKTEVRSDYQKITGQWYCMLLEIASVKTGHKTVVKMIEPTFNTGLSDDLFTTRQLKRME